MNQSTSGSETQLDCPLTIFIDILTNYFERVVCIVGLVSNGCCVFVFAKVLLHHTFKGHIFKYLFLKSLHITCYFVFDIFDIAYDCKACSVSHSYWLQVWRVGFYLYVKHINELCSGLLELAACFDRLITINKRVPLYRSNLTFYIVGTSTLLFSAAFYSFYWFKYDIVDVSRNTTNSDFTLKPSEFSSTASFANLLITSTLIRDVLILVLMFPIELLIFYSLQRTTRRKKRFNEKISSTRTNVLNAVKAERNQTIMIVLIGVNYLAHVPTVIQNLPHTKTAYWTCYYDVSRNILKLSYVTPFFIYFGLNTIFKRYVLEKIPCTQMESNRVRNNMVRPHYVIHATQTNF